MDPGEVKAGHWTERNGPDARPGELDREAFHPERGPETLGTIVRPLAGHDFNHLAQLERL